MILAENIKKTRKEKNLSQDDIAEKLGVSRQVVSKWESGQAEPTAQNLLHLSETLKEDIPQKGLKTELNKTNAMFIV